MQTLLYSQNFEETGVLSLLLQQAGLLVQSVSDLEHAVLQWAHDPLDLIVVALDDSSPIDRKQLIQLRGHSAAPIILISESLSGNQQVQCYEDGIDLVVLRPYHVRVLLAQVRALLRRTAGVPFFSLPRLILMGLTLDPTARVVTVGESEPKRLTQLEFRLLYTLMTHAKQIIPTERIVEQVWGYSGEGNRELVRGLVQRLRSKVEVDPGNPQFIRTEAGIGYYFNRYED